MTNFSNNPFVRADTSRRLYLSINPSSPLRSFPRYDWKRIAVYRKLYPYSYFYTERLETFFRHLWQYAERPYGFAFKKSGQSLLPSSFPLSPLPLLALHKNCIRNIPCEKLSGSSREEPVSYEICVEESAPIVIKRVSLFLPLKDFIPDWREARWVITFGYNPWNLE